MPVADFNLAAGQHLYFSHHYLLWRDDQVLMEQMSLRQGFISRCDKQPGLLLLHCAGNCFQRTLAPDEMLLVKQ
ncbi:MAG: hypothetical protein ACP5QA_11370 [Phycisphaerae bacterium]